MTARVEYDFVGRLKAFVESTDLSDPAQIGEQMLAGMTKDQRAKAFAQVVSLVVSVYLTRWRFAGRSSTQAAAATPKPGTPTRNRNARIREWWQEELRTRWHGATGWKTLGEFTVEDFVFGVEERTKRVEAIKASADWMQRCAETMWTLQVTRFDQLDRETLVRLLQERGQE